MTEPWAPGPWGVDVAGSSENGPVYEVTHAGARIQTTNPATARLIAAAPEMAALLTRAEDELDAGYKGPVLDDIRALLAEIRGES